MNHRNLERKGLRFHNLMVEAVAQALIDIFEGGRYADKVIEYNLKNQKKWGSRDRKFFAESVYEMVRWWRLLWALAGREPHLDVLSIKTLWSIWWWWKQGILPEGFEYAISVKELEKNLTALKQQGLGTKESIPDWLVERGIKELGSIWSENLPYLNRPARVYIRVNTLKTTAEALIQRLEEDGIVVHPVPKAAPETLVLEERKNVFTSKAFHEGLFEVQDWASQHVAPSVGVEPGMRVLDACAGAGGKSLHLATLMKNRGKIIAMDIHEWKLKELRKRATRNAIDIIEVKTFEGQKTIKRWGESFDRILMDVPCSGLGVLRRNPDTKWKLTSEELSRLAQVQAEILDSYSKLLKPGGQMVYSTCSLLPSENQNQVAAFLFRSPQFELIQDQTFFPKENDWDGFYVAVLKRKN